MTSASRATTDGRQDGCPHSSTEQLATEGRIRMERHVGECIDCRRMLAGLRHVLDALHNLPTLAGEADAVGLAASVRLRLNDPPSA